MVTIAHLLDVQCYLLFTPYELLALKRKIGLVFMARKGYQPKFVYGRENQYYTGPESAQEDDSEVFGIINQDYEKMSVDFAHAIEEAEQHYAKDNMKGYKQSSHRAASIWEKKKEFEILREELENYGDSPEWRQAYKDFRESIGLDFTDHKNVRISAKEYYGRYMNKHTRESYSEVDDLIKENSVETMKKEWEHKTKLIDREEKSISNLKNAMAQKKYRIESYSRSLEENRKKLNEVKENAQRAYKALILNEEGDVLQYQDKDGGIVDIEELEQECAAFEIQIKEYKASLAMNEKILQESEEILKKHKQERDNLQNKIIHNRQQRYSNNSPHRNDGSNNSYGDGYSETSSRNAPHGRKQEGIFSSFEQATGLDQHGAFRITARPTFMGFTFNIGRHGLESITWGKGTSRSRTGFRYRIWSRDKRLQNGFTSLNLPGGLSYRFKNKRKDIHNDTPSTHNARNRAKNGSMLQQIGKTLLTNPNPFRRRKQK